MRMRSNPDCHLCCQMSTEERIPHHLHRKEDSTAVRYVKMPYKNTFIRETDIGMC